VRKNATAIILAGGKSSRMGGEDKSLLPVRGIPLIQHIVNQLNQYFDEIIIGANDTVKYDFLGFRIVPDIEKGKGPLMGIYSCLKSSESEVNFVTGCDIPVMNIDLILSMLKISEGFDIVIPLKSKSEYEPLYAVYRKSVIEKAEHILRNGGRKIVELLGVSKVKVVELTDTFCYFNINTRDDYNYFINSIS